MVVLPYVHVVSMLSIFSCRVLLRLQESFRWLYCTPAGELWKLIPSQSVLTKFVYMCGWSMLLVTNCLAMSIHCNLSILMTLRTQSIIRVTEVLLTTSPDASAHQCSTLSSCRLAFSQSLLHFFLPIFKFAVGGADHSLVGAVDMV